MKKPHKIPHTLDEAIKMVISRLEPADINFIKNEKDPNSVHMGFGMWLRNNLGLWKNNTPFKKDIKKRFKLFGHADDCSGLLLVAVWAKVRKKDVEESLSREAASYTRHWIQEGINPKTGKKI